MKIASNLLGSRHIIDECGGLSAKTLTKSAFIFLFSYVILFLGMSLRPSIYDEGIVLTAAMRVAAGQIPHRDFYTNYGPAQYYVLAGLFKLFGQSMLVERLYDLMIRALVVTSVYTIASSYCRRSVALFTSSVTVLWLFGLNFLNPGAAALPVSLLNLVGCALVLPTFLSAISTRRMLAAGSVAGLAAMFRYDTGVALLVIHACFVMIAIYLSSKSKSDTPRIFASTFCPYLLGFAIVALPPTLYYLSVATLHPFIHDIILYPVKYYRRGRSLPFPPIPVNGIENLADYLPIAIIGISLYVAIVRRFKVHKSTKLNPEGIPKEQEMRGFLIMFGLLALAMYLKGFVRISPVQLYLCTVPSLLLLAVLFQHRMTLPRSLHFSITCLVWLSVLAATSSSIHAIQAQCGQHSFVLESLLSSARQTTPEAKTAWCRVTNALTKGLCFTPEDDRIQTIEFIDNHTRPGQPLFVGLAKHDKIFANDNLIYFAAQRLPATRWSQFDPDLQNREDIQRQMVHELEVTTPPYVVLDSEFELLHEPNDSSISTGVTLLDEYLHGKYKHIETFGTLSIWQWINAP
jgi:hypothetical protein